MSISPLESFCSEEVFVKIKIVVGAALLAVVGVAMVTFFFRERVLAEVGTTKITDKEVRLARKALEPLMPNIPDEAAVLDRMVKGQAIVELLKLKGIANLEEALQQEMARFEGNAEAGKQFEKVKKKLGNDPEKLKKLVLVPMVADRLAFQEGYLKDDEFNRNQIDKAEEFLKAVQKNPKSFSEIARRENLPLTSGKWIKGKGLILDNPLLGSFTSNTYASAQREAERQGIMSLDKLEAGQILDHVVDNKSGLWIIKSGGPLESKNGIKIEAVVVKREPFGLWMQKNARAVAIKRMPASELKSK
jgi:hypothetical protein